MLSTSAFGWISLPAFAAIITGVALSHVITSNVQVEKVTLVGDTPALHLFPSAPGPHPTALLGHGVTASKETLFRFGEALANAGFECFIIDFPGHGEMRQVFSIHDIGLKPAQVARSLGPVDVYLGHSMGAGAGAVSVREAGFSPRFFIALGANPQLGEHGPPLLLLAGRFEEFVSPAALMARKDARVVISPWSDHAFELLDPVLINVAVEAACEAVGKTPPAPQTAWLWRLAGLVLAMAGALALVLAMPELPQRFAQLRGALVPLILIGVQALTLGTWFNWAPGLHRLPLQVALAVTIWLGLLIMGRFRLPQWGLVALSGTIAFGCAILAGHLLIIITGIISIILLCGMIVGASASHRGTRQDGNLAMAIFAGYAIGQWIPKFL